MEGRTSDVITVTCEGQAALDEALQGDFGDAHKLMIGIIIRVFEALEQNGTK